MILNPKEDKPEDKVAAQSKIDDIYQKLQQGEKFEELAKQFSEDKSSSSRGGVLARFGSGQLSAEEFENIAFTLTPENPISAPFQTRFGWHIVKLIEKHALKSFDEMKVELESKVGKDDRSRLITNSLNEKLQKKYAPKRDAKLYALLVKSVTADFYESKWEVPANKAFAAKLVGVGAKEISGNDFLAYLKDQQKSGLKIKPVASLVDYLYKQYLEEQLSNYYTDNLEQEFPEFATVMEEYRDGLLLFDLMEKEIWEKSKTDTLGLHSFFETRKFNYLWKNRLEALVVSSTQEDVIKKAQKLLKKGVGAEKIKEALNTKDKVVVMTNSGTFEEGNDALPKNVPFQVGLTGIAKEGEYYFITNVSKIVPSTTKTLAECKGKVINDYQQFLEQKWVDDLKAEFSVQVNQAVFEAVKNQLKK
jgi:peptidyl-prolyl cis-trans isomerase SurA